MVTHLLSTDLYINAPDPTLGTPFLPDRQHYVPLRPGDRGSMYEGSFPYFAYSNNGTSNHFLTSIIKNLDIFCRGDNDTDPERVVRLIAPSQMFPVPVDVTDPFITECEITRIHGSLYVRSTGQASALEFMHPIIYITRSQPTTAVKTPKNAFVVSAGNDVVSNFPNCGYFTQSSGAPPIPATDIYCTVWKRMRPHGLPTTTASNIPNPQITRLALAGVVDPMVPGTSLPTGVSPVIGTNVSEFPGLGTVLPGITYNSSYTITTVPSEFQAFFDIDVDKRYLLRQFRDDSMNLITDQLYFRIGGYDQLGVLRTAASDSFVWCLSITIDLEYRNYRSTSAPPFALP